MTRIIRGRGWQVKDLLLLICMLGIFSLALSGQERREVSLYEAANAFLHGPPFFRVGWYFDHRLTKALHAAIQFFSDIS
jgi:hypothetical protein